jgi:LacI family transcriptional regulator
LANIRDVARAAGVSTATVSRVLNGSTRVSGDACMRVQAAAATLDYWPNPAARSLRQNRTHLLGILLPDLFGEFFSEVIRGIDHEARKERFQILVSSSHAGTEAIATAARSMRGRVDGLIVMAPDAGSPHLIERITRKLPVVLLNTGPAVPGCRAISVANVDGARAAVRHLLELGHRRVAIVKGPHGNVDAAERLRGYREAMADGGHETRIDLELEGDFTESSGYRAAAALLKLNPRPTAVFAANDYMAIGLMSALAEAAIRVPGQMAVAGFDDIPIAHYLRPALTTVHVDAYELGSRAMQLLISALSDDGLAPCLPEVIPTTLVVRESCGTKPASGTPAREPYLRTERSTRPELKERQAHHG